MSFLLTFRCLGDGCTQSISFGQNGVDAEDAARQGKERLKEMAIAPEAGKYFLESVEHVGTEEL